MRPLGNDVDESLSARVTDEMRPLGEDDDESVSLFLRRFVLSALREVAPGDRGVFVLSSTTDESKRLLHRSGDDGVAISRELLLSAAIALFVMSVVSSSKIREDNPPRPRAICGVIFTAVEQRWRLYICRAAAPVGGHYAVPTNTEGTMLSRARYVFIIWGRKRVVMYRTIRYKRDVCVSF